MKKIYPGLITSMLCIAFILQSCCCIPKNGSTSKYCDCGNKNVAKKQKPAKEKEKSSPSRSKGITEAGLNDIISGRHEKLIPAVSNEIRIPAAGPATPAVVPVNSTQPTLPDHVVYAKKKERGFARIDKLPLGIKGMSTHVSAGPNMSFINTGIDDGGMEYKKKAGVGFQFGIGTTYTFSEKFSVDASILFKKNSASDVLSYSIPGEPGGGSTSTEFKSTYSFNYLSAPLLAHYAVSDDFTVMAGPEINILTGASVKESGYGDSEKTDIKDESVKTGVGIQAGVKYHIPKSPVAVKLIFDHRLSRLNEKSPGDYTPGGGNYDSPPARINSLQLSLEWQICAFLRGVFSL